jgi:molecular chaperone DnaJ
VGNPEAVLGEPVESPTVEGKVKVQIEPGTQPGKILRLRGKGLPDVNGYGRGDLLARVNVWVPKSLSKEEKKMVEKMRDTGGFCPTASDKKSFLSKMKDFFE